MPSLGAAAPLDCRLVTLAERIRMNKEIVSTSDAPSAIGPYSQAVKTGLVVFTSGQIGIDPASGELRQDFDGTGPAGV